MAGRRKRRNLIPHRDANRHLRPHDVLLNRVKLIRDPERRAAVRAQTTRALILEGARRLGAISANKDPAALIAAVLAHLPAAPDMARALMEGESLEAAIARAWAVAESAAAACLAEQGAR